MSFWEALNPDIMIKIIKIMCFVICLLLINPSKLIAEPSNIVQKVLTKEDILVKIDFYSAKYKVSSDLMKQIVSCETAGTFNYKMQSTCNYKFNDPRRKIIKGEQEMSYGLSQIHLPDHPDISYEQAINPDFALNFLAENLSKGRGSMWSCYKN